MNGQLWIGGAWLESTSGARRAVPSPYDGRPVGSVAVAGREDVRAAVDAAREAFDRGPWPRWSPKARGDVFLAAARLLADRAEAIATLESANQGKTIKQAA
ncbi:MAG TPA: aldehyde dehydrogenase family protein, partial [Thermoplasmata archaeon]|nr:aldehyde dehydrogenase family protein [Thermoplasmata archaeon]